VAQALGAESDLGALGNAVRQLFELHRQQLGAFGPLLETSFSRGLWLFEGLDGSSPEVLKAVVTLRDLHKLGRDLQLARELAEGVMLRRMTSAPLDCRGAALGYLWSLELGPGEAEAGLALKALAPPEVIGDFLAGLFALAREEVQRAEGLLGLLDSVLTSLDRPDFLRALPGLRMAFSILPPRERQAVALLIARLHGLESTFSLMRAGVDPSVVAAGMQLDLQIEELVQRHGL
jgi:hypothetical protein